MRVGLIAALGAAAMLCGCAGAGPSAEQAKASTVPVTMTPAEIAAVKEGAKKGLKDPNSAMFGDLFAAADAKGVVNVCGFVNAKNSYGGYTGMEPFTGILSRKPLSFTPVGYGGTDADNYAVRHVCADAGISL